MSINPIKGYGHYTTGIDDFAGAPSKAASLINPAMWVDFLDLRIQGLKSEPADQSL